MKLRFSKCRAEDFPEYQSWFEDSELNLQLGPMDVDDEWFHAVMHETDGCHYSVFQRKELIAVVGVIFPDAAHPAYYITDFAMKPRLRNQGIGSHVLGELMKMHKLQFGETWKAFVDSRNPQAKAFFEKNGWICVSATPDEHEMLLLERNPHTN